MPQPDNPQSILIIKPSSLGDVISAMPVLRGIRRTFPNAKVTWLVATSCKDIIADDPDLSDIIIFDRKKLGNCWRSPSAFSELMKFRGKLKAPKFDWVIDLQGLLRSGIFTSWTKAPLRAGFANAREGAPLFYNHKHKPQTVHTVDRNIELATSLGIDIRKDQDMTLHVAPEAADFAAQLCREQNISAGEYVVCVPPTRWKTKLYPTRYWRKVVAAISQKFPVILLGSPAKDEVDLCDAVAKDQPGKVIDLAGKTSLKQLVAIISLARGVICSDSAAQYIAPAAGTSCLSLIGPTRPERTGPFSKNAQAIVADVPCQGCLKKKCHHISCMQSITPQTVIDKATEMFDLE